jgi:SAM-dependent methyltransferase
MKDNYGNDVVKRIENDSRFGTIEVVNEESLYRKILKLSKFILTGNGLEKDQQRVGFLRYLLNNAILFKLVGRYFSWKYKHTLSRHKTNLDLDSSNLKEIYDYTVTQNISQPAKGTNRRSEIYYKLLTLPPAIPKNNKLLIIGGKNVTEIFIAWLYGFQWNKIFAIDLFSLHPKIEMMNMEEMSYPDETFDCISMANVYGYNDHPIPAFREIARVMKKGATFSFNSVFHPEGKTQTYRTSSDELKEIYNKLNLKVLYHYQTIKDDGISTGDVWLLEKTI